MTDPIQPPPFPPPPRGGGFVSPPDALPTPGVTPGGPPPVGGLGGMVADPSTLAATGLIGAVLFAIGAGLLAFLGEPFSGGFRIRLLNLTATVDAGHVALLGIAVALLLLTPDPPGGFSRPLLLQMTAGLAGIITIFALLRAPVILFEDAFGVSLRLSGCIAALGVAIAAATVAIYAAKKSFPNKEGPI